MSINKTAKGLQVSLDEYRKIHVDGGGACFLDIPSQTVIREGELGKFLAHAQEDLHTRQLLFELVDERGEVLSSSRPLRNKRELPISEIDRLERAIAELKEKLNSSSTLPPKSRVLVEQLSLPDPDSAPEMYRIYGPTSHRRLGVLWGCETASGRSVAPDVAVERLRRRVQAGWWIVMEQLLWLALFALPLFLLAIMAWSLWPTRGDKPAGPRIGDRPEYVRVTTDGVSRQFLRVSVDRPQGLPNTITAWSGRSGVIRCGIAAPVTVAAEERCRFAIVRPGVVRVEWLPTAGDSEINGEFVELRFEEDGTVLTPVDTPIDKPTDKPADKPTDKPADKPTDKPADKAAEKPTDKPTDKPVDKPMDKPADKPTDKPADKPADKPTDKPAEKAAEKPTDKPTDKPVDKPMDKPADKPTDKPTDKPADKPVDKPKDKPADEPTEKPQEKPKDTPKTEPKQPSTPITQEGGLVLALVEDVANQLKLRVQVKDKPMASLEKVEWTIDGKTYKGNPVTFSPERARIEIEVEGLSDGRSLKVKATLRRSFTLDK
jgi:hypothetical protein